MARTIVRHYRIAMLDIEVDAAPDAQAWFEEFFGPTLVSGQSDSPRVQLRLLVDPTRHEALERLPLRKETSTVGFVLDQGNVFLSERVGGEPWHFDESSSVHFAVRPGPQVDVLAAEAGPGRVGLMRVAREFAMNDLQRRGSAMIHSAAVLGSKGAVLIAGEKRRGKTSLLLFALRSGAFRMIANDRVALLPRSGAWEVWGIPTIVSIRPGNFELFSDLPWTKFGSDWPHRHRVAELRPLHPSPLPRDCGISMSPAQFLEIANAQAQSQGPLQAWVFPRIDENLHGVRLRELTAEEFRRRRRSVVFGPTTTPDAQHFALPDAHEHTHSRVNEPVVPAFELVLGRGAYDPAAGLQAVLTNIMGAL